MKCNFKYVPLKIQGLTLSFTLVSDFVFRMSWKTVSLIPIQLKILQMKIKETWNAWKMKFRNFGEKRRTDAGGARKRNSSSGNGGQIM